MYSRSLLNFQEKEKTRIYIILETKENILNRDHVALGWGTDTFQLKQTYLRIVFVSINNIIDSSSTFLLIIASTAHRLVCYK